MSKQDKYQAKGDGDDMEGLSERLAADLRRSIRGLVSALFVELRSYFQYYRPLSLSIYAVWYCINVPVSYVGKSYYILRCLV